MEEGVEEEEEGGEREVKRMLRSWSSRSEDGEGATGSESGSREARVEEIEGEAGSEGDGEGVVIMFVRVLLC